MFKKISAALILSVAVAMAPASVDAQQHDHADQAQGSSGTMGTHMRAYMPQRLLSMQEALGLSEGQMSRLQEMAEAASEQSHGHMEQMMARGQGACEMVSGDSPDWDAYQDRMEAMADGMVSGHVSMMRSAVEARSVLSPDQIETVAAGMQHGMNGGETDHSMMQGGMMQMMSAMCMGGTG
ncbi:MAG: Spy/CpxP family protein refolding chaperone [Gemmatimonadota bacterium]|nr:Spy/CpxP family protein refolding chaperone [Gemmatimonadota bacterium]